MSDSTNMPKDVVSEHVEARSIMDKTNDPTGEGFPHHLTKAQQRSVMRRLDLRVTVATGAIFCISLMDRTNLGVASIAGMTKDLHLSVENRYNLVALTFFIPYLIFEIPGTVLGRVIGPRLFLGGSCVLWGIVSICIGLVQTWEQLVGLRVLLGLFEAGYFPVCVYLLSTYYTRYEVQKRYTMFYTISIASSAFAGILAYGLSQLDGALGRAGWRWIFYVEGAITVLLGFIGLLVIVGFPDKSSESWKFLTPAEVEWVIYRIQQDRGDADVEPFNIRKFIAAAADVRMWLLGLIYVCVTTVLYSVAFFLPIILHGEMGFSIGNSQLLVAPPYAFGVVLMVLCAWVGDKYRVRGPILIVNSFIAIIGLIVMTWAKSSGTRYFGTFLVTAGINSNVPTSMAYQANNIRGQWNRAAASCILVFGGGIGGVAGSLIFRSMDAPRYLNGVYGCICANVVVIITVVGFSIYYRHQNKLAREGKILIAGLPGFLYTI